MHFLDATICHYIIEKTTENDSFQISTIHDSFFFVKPKEAYLLRECYKQGLICAHKLHVYNFFYWLYLIHNLKKKRAGLFDKQVGDVYK